METKQTPAVILRCQLPRRKNRFEQCGGLIGGVPDDAVVTDIVERVEDAPPGCYALRCWGCKRIVVVCPPMDQAA